MNKQMQETQRAKIRMLVAGEKYRPKEDTRALQSDAVRAMACDFARCEATATHAQVTVTEPLRIQVTGICAAHGPKDRTRPITGSAVGVPFRTIFIAA